jgi:subtilisin-like proprotein convertase family protein
MKTIFCTSLLSLGLTLGANAANFFSQTFNSGFLNGGGVPDGSLNGWNDTRAVSGPSGPWSITDVQVTLDISGGYNGDLYAYLAHGDGFAVLLNRVGMGLSQGNAFGYSNPGMDVTLSDTGAGGNIHSYGGLTTPSGPYQPDGRNISPLSPPALFDTAGTGANFSSFTGLDPNGNWTLFIADVSAGGGQSMVLSWGLTVNAVPTPEPRPITLAALALGLSFLWAARNKRNRRTTIRRRL